MASSGWCALQSSLWHCTPPPHFRSPQMRRNCGSPPAFCKPRLVIPGWRKRFGACAIRKRAGSALRFVTEMALMISVPCRSTVGGHLASLRLLGVHLFRFDIGCVLIPASMRRLQGGYSCQPCALPEITGWRLASITARLRGGRDTIFIRSLAICGRDTEMLSFARDRQDVTLKYQTECTVCFVIGICFYPYMARRSQSSCRCGDARHNISPQRNYPETMAVSTGADMLSNKEECEAM